MFSNMKQFKINELDIKKNIWCANLPVKIIIKENLNLENNVFITGFYGLGATGYK